jgi:transketolase
MRATFIKTLVELAEKDDRVYLLTADMGYGLVEPFSDKFPDRFINVGVAEQNMIGVATGLALSGKIVFVYSIVNFPTMRCLEQIRNCVCYHNLRVHVVAGSTGLAYGALGMSHHATEDISIMRSLPNMTVIAPDLSEVESVTKAIYQSTSPCYLRLGWADAGQTVNSRSFEIGKASTLVSGSDVCLISCGSMVANTLKVAEELARDKIRALVISMPTIKPIDAQAVVDASHIVNEIFTIEEHNIIGGLGSAVAEVIASRSLNVKFKRLGIPDVYVEKVGNRDELLKSFHLTVNDIVSEVKNAIH